MIDWIDIKKSKPRDGEKVLVSDGYIVTAATFNHLSNGLYYLDGCGHGGFEWRWHFDDSNITHWAKLPEPPVV